MLDQRSARARGIDTISGYLRRYVPDRLPSGPASPSQLAEAAREIRERHKRDPDVHRAANRLSARLDEGDVEGAVPDARDLDAAIVALDAPKPVKPPPPRGIAELMAVLPCDDEYAVGRVVLLDFTKPIRSSLMSRDLSGDQVSIETKRDRYALSGLVLPEVETGSVFAAPSGELLGSLPVFREASNRNACPGWLRDIGAAFGVPVRPDRADADRRLLVAAVDISMRDAAATARWLSLWWLRELRTHVVGPVIAIEAQPEPTDALNAIKRARSLGR